MAITRPRTTGGVDSCTVPFAVVIRVCDASPTRARARPKSQNDGMRAAATHPNPKIAVEMKRKLSRGFSRWAESSAPITEPTAMTEESTPNSAAPWWKTTVDIVEMKIGKLRPKVPIRKTITRMTMMSGRDLT